MARLNRRLVKIHKNYTVEEAAELLGTHKNTVRCWTKSGLPVCDDKRPTLILGRDLREFLQRRQQSRKRQCKSFELYCMRCRSPKMPAGNMVDFTSISERTGRLTGICPDCETMMNRFTNHASLVRIQAVLEVHMPIAREHISKSSDLPENSDFRQEHKNHGKTSSE